MFRNLAKLFIEADGRERANQQYSALETLAVYGFADALDLQLQLNTKCKNCKFNCFNVPELEDTCDSEQ